MSAVAAEIENLKREIERSKTELSQMYLELGEVACSWHKAIGYAPSTERKSTPKPAIENATAFYVNIGKLSKGTAHEMVDFICEKTGLSTEDIISVAYKQNYSFVYIRSDKADGVIEAVNGQTYKGRKVKMNFSKEKDEQ